MQSGGLGSTMALGDSRPSAHGSNSRCPAPAFLDASHRGNFFEIMKDKLTARYSGRGQHESDHGIGQSTMPCTAHGTNIYYFEVAILNSGKPCKVAIGLASREHDMCTQIGALVDSYGYNVERGSKHESMDSLGPRSSEL